MKIQGTNGDVIGLDITRKLAREHWSYASDFYYNHADTMRTLLEAYKMPDLRDPAQEYAITQKLVNLN